MGSSLQEQFHSNLKLVKLWRQRWMLHPEPLVEILKLIEILKIKICVKTCDKNSTLGSVVPLAMFSYFVKSEV